METPHDPRIEDLIIMEIVVDAYGPEERAIGWYYYLENTLDFPFTATCRKSKRTNRLATGQTCTVVSMAEVDECDDDMYVMIGEDGDELAVNLDQLTPVDDSDPDTTLAVEAWHYWKDRGYQF